MAWRKHSVPGASRGLNRLKEEIARELGVDLKVLTRPRKSNSRPNDPL